jgi:WYL domain
VLVRVRRGWLDVFGRICAANLTGPLPLATGEWIELLATGEWIELRLRFAAVKAARTLLSFGASVEVMSPPEVRADLAALAAEIADLYSNVRLD